MEAMLVDNKTITARGVVRRMGGVFRHASDLTRRPDRREKLTAYQQRQAELRALMAKADKQSKKNLVAQLSRKDAYIEELRRQRDTLIASHKAVFLAVGEMGWMKAWKRFFSGYERVLDELHAMGAMPKADDSERNHPLNPE